MIYAYELCHYTSLVDFGHMATFIATQEIQNDGYKNAVKSFLITNKGEIIASFGESSIEI